MGCVLEFDERRVRYELFCQGQKQQILIDILLNYAKLKISDVANLLSVSIDDVHNIYNNKFLQGESAMNLLYLFLIFIND